MIVRHALACRFNTSRESADKLKLIGRLREPPFDQIQPQKLLFERTFERSAMELRIHND
jgi:hypothetical protein